MRTIWMAMVGLVAIGGAARAEVHHERDCSTRAIRRSRAEAAAAIRAKDAPAAIELLEPLVRDCPKSPSGTVTVEVGWIRSDLGFAYYRNGQYVDCLALLSSLSVYADDGREDRLDKAVEHNLGRCTRGLDTKYAVKAGGCKLASDDAIASASAPPALVPRGATAACVMLVPGKSERSWPEVALVWTGARGVERKVLPTEGGPLDHGVFAFHLSSIAASTAAGSAVLRVRGSCDTCDDGGSIDAFYDWNGTLLASMIDLTH